MEKGPEGKIESKEYGENVEIILKFIRHGERTPEGFLTDYGREITKEKAKGVGLEKEEFGAVKAIGSPAGPKGPEGMGRSLETADIYAREIAGDEAFNTRKSEILNYETFKNPIPLDWDAIYNSKLPEDFENLPDEEKAAASKRAQAAALDHLLSLDTPEARNFKKETAGSFAYVIDHYSKMAKRLKPDSKVLMPSGTHGGLMEFILKEALVRKLDDGTEIHGFEKIEEIGGGFDPSEAFNVDIKTNEKGDLLPIKVTFDNPARPKFKEMYLDPKKIEELSKYYAELHGTS